MNLDKIFARVGEDTGPFTSQSVDVLLASGELWTLRPGWGWDEGGVFGARLDPWSQKVHRVVINMSRIEALSQADE